MGNGDFSEGHNTRFSFQIEIEPNNPKILMKKLKLARMQSRQNALPATSKLKKHMHIPVGPAACGLLTTTDPEARKSFTGTFLGRLTTSGI
jgi:hypothetical protein